MKRSDTILMIAVCSVFLSGCPAITTINLENDSQRPISVHYLTGYESKIEPNQTDIVDYSSYCFRIKSDQNFYEYQAVWPEKYIKGIFSSKTNGIFTEDYRLKIYNKNNQTDFLELKRGCEPRNSIDSSVPVNN